jgi:hypothetical protein
MLAFKISMEANEQNNDADGDKGRTKWLADVPKMLRCITTCFASANAGVETEELCYGDADAGKGQRGAEPREEGAFYV